MTLDIMESIDINNIDVSLQQSVIDTISYVIMGD